MVVELNFAAGTDFRRVTQAYQIWTLWSMDIFSETVAHCVESGPVLVMGCGRDCDDLHQSFLLGYNL